MGLTQVTENEDNRSRRTNSHECGSTERFSKKLRADSRGQSNRSRSRSCDLSLKSKRRNLFNQSFDSKLSEFSDNGEMVVLSRPTGIREYFECPGEDCKNSLQKSLRDAPERSKQEPFLEDRGPFDNEITLKNFTFSKNKGGKSSPPEAPLEPSLSHRRDKPTRRSKMMLTVESPPNEPAQCPAPKRGKRPKFQLDLGLTEAAETMRPPPLGNRKKFNMAGSSLGGIGFSSGTGQQGVLNAPRNKKKVKFAFGSEILKHNLRNNFKLPKQKSRFQADLEIVIPEENSRDVECDSDEPTLELPCLKERRSRKSTRPGMTRLEIPNEHGGQPCPHASDKVILVDDFQDSVPNRSESRSDSEPKEPVPPDRTTSNSPRHVSGSQNSEGANGWTACPTKNLEIQFDTELINRTMGRRGLELVSGCRTNPLPTTKNANQKYKKFGFGGGRKKRHLTVSLTGEEVFVASHESKREVRIDEVSNEEGQSQSGGEGTGTGQKRSLKMKINSKNSEHTHKNFSKQSSQFINSIQSNTNLSEFAGQQLRHIAKMRELGRGGLGGAADQRQVQEPVEAVQEPQRRRGFRRLFAAALAGRPESAVAAGAAAGDQLGPEHPRAASPQLQQPDHQNQPYVAEKQDKNRFGRRGRPTAIEAGSAFRVEGGARTVAQEGVGSEPKRELFDVECGGPERVGQAAAGERRGGAEGDARQAEKERAQSAADHPRWADQTTADATTRTSAFGRTRT